MPTPRRTQMLRALVFILSLAFATHALTHTDTKWTKGPQGGHMVDAGKQHWELVAKASELTLYVIDEDEKPINTGVARSRRRFSWRAKCTMWSSNIPAEICGRRPVISQPRRECG